MASMILPQGISASGKSTWVSEEIRKLRLKHREFAVVSRDDIRWAMFQDYNPDVDAELIVVKVRDEMINVALAGGRIVFVDEMNLKEGNVRNLARIARKHHANVSIKPFTDVPLKLCLERNKSRDRTVPENVLVSNHRKHIVNGNVNFSKLIADELYAERDSYAPDLSKPSAYIFDIDGTLSENNSGRGWYDWDRVDEDDPVFAVIQIAQSLRNDGHIILGMSGRSEASRSLTEKWLKDWTVPYTELVMREDGDDRKDSIVKRELFDKHFSMRYNVLGCFDDRPQVIRMWADYGIKVFHCGDCEYDF